jgi:hypothetical protein
LIIKYIKSDSLSNSLTRGRIQNTCCQTRNFCH